jgi:hypothetical protein
MLVLGWAGAGVGAGLGAGGAAAGIDSAVRAAGAAGTVTFGLEGGAAGFGAGGAEGFGAGGITVTGLACTGAGAAVALGGGAGAEGFGARTGAGFGGAATGFGAGGAATGFALAAGGGPNVMRERSGSAEIRGKETSGLFGAMAGEIRGRFESLDKTWGRSKGRKSATAGSAGAGADGISPSRSSSPNPVVRNRDAVKSLQRIAGEKSIAPCFSSALVPFWFPAAPNR